MRESFVLNGFFFEIHFAECERVQTKEKYYAEYSVPCERLAHYWQGQAKILDRETGTSHTLLFKTCVDSGPSASDLKEYIFGSESLNGRPFKLEDSICKEAVIDYLARQMLARLKGAKKGAIIAEISIPQLSLKELQKFGLAPKKSSNKES